jgi:hypothetical protein
MTYREEGRASLVDFLRSLKSLKGGKGIDRPRLDARFAKFDPRVKGGEQSATEEFQLVRSAN